MADESVIEVKRKKSEPPPPRRKPKVIQMPRRTPSVVMPERQIVFVTADKLTCKECTCFPKEDPYVRPKKLNPCLKSPLTLYELSAAVVDRLKFPQAFTWNVEQVADWMSEELDFPEYRSCIIDNHIDGMRLLMLEDLSKLPEINIHYYGHVRDCNLCKTELYRVVKKLWIKRNVEENKGGYYQQNVYVNHGQLHCTKICDILRWMKIIMPEPVYRDHWDLVWYQKPDFPKVMFAKIPRKPSEVHIPHYRPKPDTPCYEYQTPRKYRFQTNIPDGNQLIWMEKTPKEIEQMIKMRKKREKEKKRKLMAKVTHPIKESNLYQKRISLTGLAGKDFILARRLMPKPKFMASN